MTEPTKKCPSECSSAIAALCTKVADLQKHVDEIRHTTYLRGEIDAKIGSIDRATALAAAALDKRLDAMNEFRESLKDQANQMLTKAEYFVYRSRIEEDIRLLRESRAELMGKASQSSVVGAYVLAVFGLLLGVLGLAVEVISR